MSFLPLQTNQSSDLSIVATSKDPQGLVYGTYTASVHTSNYQTNFASHQACVLARCPTIEEEYTEVDLQIAYDKRSQCNIG